MLDLIQIDGIGVWVRWHMRYSQSAPLSSPPQEHLSPFVLGGIQNLSEEEVAPFYMGFLISKVYNR